ncbi:NepR family anti-sigma factor [Defluviimonas sp. WL0024]|uniref:NepR family anti-sigma factor n=1 Tax=Albidovulum salinarum TaxID=2984153 RepID=A0ABT2X8H4_9RHOB|nr:NepR family anti-sigma factor [Defluviimonas sp. WL0024]MCU9850244.1 NepR family anti-sigma factor [Defluviimonas sp. WL0024]
MKKSNEKTKLQEQIDENLKRVYHEALEQELPDRFKDLLDQLRQKDEKQ